MNHKFQIVPRDMIFMRDARPMEGSDAGLGANWPRPDQLWNALINAFHLAWPERQAWEGAAHRKTEEEEEKEKKRGRQSSDRFGALKTLGPFPLDSKTGLVYYPAPLDLDMEIVPCPGTDLPEPLTCAFRGKNPGKQEPRHWLSAQEYQHYLKGGGVGREEPELYDNERKLGIAIDAGSGAAEDGKLYQAEYLRPREGVSLAFTASCDLKPKGEPDKDKTVDVFEKFGLPRELILGGQQGVVRMAETKFERIKPPGIASRHLRWTLLSPAVFLAGWLPGWCVDSRRDIPEAEKKPLGTVMLRNKPSGELLAGKLIAARIGKPLAFSGWDLRTGPKPTLLAVPAGSCYVFDCGTAENAQKLADRLNLKPCSDRFGEKGFGVGVCSSAEGLG
jgi:CRISPR type III-B/RAMP module-associated protein Cmr3